MSNPRTLPTRQAKPEPQRGPVVRSVGAETANALVTEAPLTTAELDLLRVHFASIAGLCADAGPRFANARRDAVDMHNRAVRRIRGIRDEIKRRATMEADQDLMEIA